MTQVQAIQVDVTGEWVEPDGATFAERCRQARRERGWSYDDMRRELQDVGHDTTRASYAAMERGEREVRLAEALALQAVLGVDIEPDTDDGVERYGVAFTVHHPDGRMYTASAYGVPAGGLDAALQSAWRMTRTEHRV